MNTPDDLLEAICEANSLGVVTGAGISAPSGIPTYRGVGGIYEDPAEGDRTVEALSGPTFQRDPDRTWKVLGQLARTAHGAQPNAGHHAIVALERVFPRFTLLTQNVDGLHARAGSREPIEIHGNVFKTRCLRCRQADDLSAETLRSLDRQPRCAACSGPLRPAVVLFEEMLPEPELARLESELLSAVPDIVIMVGTSAQFPYVLAPVRYAIELGHGTVDVNPDPQPATPGVRWHLRESADVALPRLIRELSDRRPDWRAIWESEPDLLG